LKSPAALPYHYGRRTEDRKVFLTVAIWLLLTLLASYALTRLWQDLHTAKGFRFAFLPGLIVHELSHVTGCFLTGADVYEAKIYDNEAAHVKFGKPRLPIIGKPIIALAPIVGCLLAIWLAWTALGKPLAWDWRAPEPFTLTLSGMRDLVVEIVTRATGIFGAIFQVRTFTSLASLAFLYYLLAFSIFMGPSAEDIKHALLGVGVIAVVVLVLQYLGLLSADGGFLRGILEMILGLLSFAVVVLLAALVISLPIALLRKAVRS